jgi:hypothetical protein
MEVTFTVSHRLSTVNWNRQESKSRMRHRDLGLATSQWMLT